MATLQKSKELPAEILNDHVSVYKMVFGLYGSRKNFLRATREKHLDLTDPIVKKGMLARERLVNYHFPLVIAQIDKLRNPSLSRSDLKQAGRIALLRAIESYQLGYGSFSTHAYRIINLDLKDAGLENRMIRIPDKEIKWLNKVRRLTLNDSESEILRACSQLNLDEQKTLDVLLHYHQVMSLDSLCQ